ncbi:MAG: PAS domain-containing protein [Chlorobium sp.]|uniref:PAS domain-containing protein n=1 Tax=Chlorobium sp. TaxID=1095 RepID=UPI002F40F7A5
MKKNRDLSAFSSLMYMDGEKKRTVSRHDNGNYVSSPEEMHRIIHKMALQKIELELQNDALVQLREELTEKLDRYAGLFDFAPVGYLRLARDGSIFETNLTASRILGVDRLLLKGDRFGRFVVSEDLPLFNDLLERVFSRREKCSCAVRLLNDSISHFSVPMTAASMRGQTIRIDAVASQDGMECLAVVFETIGYNRIESDCVSCRNHDSPSSIPPNAVNRRTINER